MEVLGAVASIVQLTTIAASIIKTIYRIHNEAKEGLTRAVRRTIELESLLAILDLIKSSEPLTPNTFQVPLLIVHEHLNELDNLLANLCNRSGLKVYLHLWAVPNIIKTENKIIEGLNNLERAKNSLILHLSATQGRTLEQILEKMNQQQSQSQYGYRGPVANQSRSKFTSSSSARERASHPDEATNTLDCTLYRIQQGRMMARESKDTYPTVRVYQDEYQPDVDEDQKDIDEPAGDENPTAAPYHNASDDFVFVGNNNTIEPPRGKRVCHIGSTFKDYPSTRKTPFWRWMGHNNKIKSDQLGHIVHFFNRTSSSPTSSQSTSASGWSKYLGTRTRSQKYDD
ncbi:hypothetical protein F5B22DRAFT_433533 [Xylaria bambusicola]|uniref:uncharacterized protein n=1 Tax=Xylaria bambusicola TaxID=326684 RepID=UPI00200892A2|nr:uncharacterized protein F5B22DRAFT_433533 [Xylaria bambusicola]KAI0506866.1 hypothetical protein F5B22DRAFT_433533 [Xylaria bambusicola]